MFAYGLAWEELAEGLQQLDGLINGASSSAEALRWARRGRAAVLLGSQALQELKGTDHALPVLGGQPGAQDQHAVVIVAPGEPLPGLPAPRRRRRAKLEPRLVPGWVALQPVREPFGSMVQSSQAISLAFSANAAAGAN
jgi:hypothetical protein